jgi:hypothetical protein
VTEKKPPPHAKPALHRLIEKAIDDGAFADFYKALPILERLIETSRTAAAEEAYEDAARIALEPRAGVAPYLATAMAERMKARAQGIGQPGAGAFPHERAFRVYRTNAAGVSTAVASAPLLGRGGLLTLEEATKLRDATPESWIGVSPSCAPHSILRMEG